MCGICGSVGLYDGGRAVRSMNDRMVHRGPDSEGYLKRAGIGFGVRRLKVVDLESGDQPIFNEDGTIGVVFNGEIYNFRELRAELRELGHRFATKSDTEVVVHAYEEWGARAPIRLHGMFAFAVYDGRSTLGASNTVGASHSARIFLARDRLGIKPLYYWHDGRYFLFSSELRALLATGQISGRLSADGLYTYLAFGSVQEPLTIIDEVYSLPPAGYMLIEFSDSRLTITQERYWSPAGSENLQPCGEELRSWLSDAVRRHLISEVPLGSFLSGGIDSGTIVALATRILTEPLKTFTLGYDSVPTDERKLAAATAQRCQTDHSFRVVTRADVVADMPQALSAMDQPTADGVNTWYVSREAKRSGLTVALSGIGGDELFAGYPSFRLVPLLTSLGGPRPCLRLLPRWDSGWWLPLSTPGGRRKLAAYLAGDVVLAHPYFAVRGLFTQSQIRTLLRPQVAEQLETSAALPIWRGTVLKQTQRASELGPVSEVSWLELSQYTCSTLLRDTDMMSMAHSLEVRVPFLDFPLVERVMAIDPRYKRAQSYPKSMLIESMKGLLPSSVLNARKKTFTLPFEAWMRQGVLEVGIHKSVEYLEPWLESTQLRGYETEFDRGRLNWSRLWSIYVLGSWIRQNL